MTVEQMKRAITLDKELYRLRNDLAFVEGEQDLINSFELAPDRSYKIQSEISDMDDVKTILSKEKERLEKKIAELKKQFEDL